jgi:hypothetical protein
MVQISAATLAILNNKGVRGIPHTLQTIAETVFRLGHDRFLQSPLKLIIQKITVTLRLAVYRQSVRLGDKPLEAHGQRFILQLNPCGHSPYVTSSLTRGSVCCLQLLLIFVSTVIIRYGSRGIHDHILLSQIRDYPKPGGPGSRI